jgi:hypothetical protein
MSDYLTRLVERSLGVGEVVRPRLQSLFEPRDLEPALAGGQIEVSEERLSPVPIRTPEPQRPSAQSRSAEEPRAVPGGLRDPPLREAVVEQESPPEQQGWPPAVEPAAPEREALVHVDSPAIAQRTKVVVENGARVPRAAPPAVEHRAPPPTVGPDGILLDPLRATEQSLAPAPPEPVEPPDVRVTIGRVEVRAVLPAPPAERTPRKRAPRMTLDEYLRQKDGR